MFFCVNCALIIGKAIYVRHISCATIVHPQINVDNGYTVK